MFTKKFLNALGLVLSLLVLMGCGAQGNGSDINTPATPTRPATVGCQPGVIVTAVYNRKDLTSYDIQRQVRLEGFTETLGDSNLDNPATITLDGMDFKGLIGESVTFYDNLRYQFKDRYWVEQGGSDYLPCDGVAVDVGGAQAWKFTFYNAPIEQFLTGILGSRTNVTKNFSEAIDLVLYNHILESVEYSATLLGLDESAQLVAESVHLQFDDGSGNNRYVTWEMNLRDIESFIP